MHHPKLDWIRAKGFWSRQQDTFYDVRVAHPISSLLSRPEIFAHWPSPEHRKKHAYCQRVNNVEQAAFKPLVFSTFGMAGPETQVFLKSLAAMVCEKNILTLTILLSSISFALVLLLACCAGPSHVSEVAVHHMCVNALDL